MERKFLEGLGIEKDNVDKIMAQYGTDVTGYQTQLTTKDTEIKTLRTGLTTVNTRIAELEKVDAEELKRQLEEEKDGRAKDRQQYELKSLLSAEGCTDTDYVLYKLGDTVEFDDKGQVKDTESFVKTVKERYATQFQAEYPGGTGGTGNFRRDHSGRIPDEKNPYTQKGWNLTEQMRLEVSDPEQAKKLKTEAKIE